MRDTQRTIQIIINENGSFLKIVKKFGKLKTIDLILSFLIDQISQRFYKYHNNDSYGLHEAIFHPRDIDRWERYTYVKTEIATVKGDNFSILDVGSGSHGTSPFLNPSNHKIFALDIKKYPLKHAKSGNSILGDGRFLPFKDQTFDIVVTVDALEHIPIYTRKNFYCELKRVCKKKLIITCPLQSDDGKFQGRTYDIAFQNHCIKATGTEDQNTAQHIAMGHPTVKEITQELPDSQINGYKNCNIWLTYMLLSRRPIIGFFAGLMYLLFWKKDNNKPPYWGSIITWTPNNSKR